MSAFTDEDRAAIAELKTFEQARDLAARFLQMAKDNGELQIAAMREVDRLRAHQQAFFAGFDLEMRKPSYGDQARDFGRALLLRAQEANLYTPTENA